ncbi:hypothetical protein CEUSTIGMA_g12321.t1 [Chlamydomonas eustigma]|uniref:Uncharacterized protein n=1 Tax=Chlamydomonas eustigma TaxID=1157962 RepID=A0A250XQ20_9CHLO|nr:hypothetical protein CEUSTIGMA_g12321.t1 [Chlamydomonas eustigma]|eukprot:GAX84900.1 hypothetical protein CEUSTIGMA_g12321.t1 [Chlamydomonas eustigma]
MLSLLPFNVGLLPSGLQNPFGESDDEGSQSLLDSLRSDPNLIGLLGGSNGNFSRAATPASQLFLDSLMRATPDFIAQHFQMQQQQYTTTGNSGGGATAPSATAPAPLATSPPAAGSVAAVSTQGPTGSLSVAGPVHPELSLQVEPGREVPQVVRSSAFQSVIEQARAASQAALGFNSTSEAAPTGAAAGPSGPAPDPCSSQAADLGLDPQASHQQELARLVAAAGRDSGLLPSSSSQDMQLLRDFLRPGTPEAAWALLRGATPTPLLGAGTSSSTDMLAALGSSSSGGDPLMAAAAASWLMTGRYTPLSSQHQLLVSALSDSAPAGSGTTAAVAAVQPGVTEVQSAVHVAPDKGDGGNTSCIPYVSNGCSVMTSPQQSPVARPSPLPRPVAAPAGSMLPLHVLEQTALQVRPGNEDFTGGDIPFSVDILLRASTPVVHQ